MAYKIISKCGKIKIALKYKRLKYIFDMADETTLKCDRIRIFLKYGN
jgi:hypothetical protein